MKINSEATKEKFRATGRNISRWATAKGHNPGTVSQLIHGHIPVPVNLETTESGRIIANLREDGLLVTEEEEPKEAA
jgi:hypothetical protein